VNGQVGQHLIHESGKSTLLIHFEHCCPDELSAQIPRLRGAARPYRIACVPNMPFAHALPTRSWSYQRTNDPRAVTCPVCKLDAEFIRLTALLAAKPEPPSKAYVPPSQAEPLLQVGKIPPSADQSPWIHFIEGGKVVCGAEAKMRSEDSRAVNCPACRKTLAWLKAYSKQPTKMMGVP
jgi:hypothetical protein